MALQKTDVKLLLPERLQDTSDGGGRITNNAVISGTENSLFDDISELARVYGSISLRKFFVGITTANTDKYYGAHSIISDTPDDPAVSITLFTTNNWEDQRSNAKDYVERYLARGTKWPGYLLEKQLVGQKAILIWQRTETELPGIGSVMSLIQNEALTTEYEQYVRIVRVSEKLRTYYDGKGSYQVRVVTCEISDPLIYDFEGVAPSREDTGLNPKAIARTTIAADAARYYATKPITASAAVSDMTVFSSSIFNQLVPSAQSEIPAVDLSPANQTGVATSSQGTVSFTTSVNIGASAGMYLGNPFYPGSLSITTTGGTITDDGTELKLNGMTTIGIAQYNQGLLTFNASAPTITGTKTVVFRPASNVIRVSDSGVIDIYPENRGYVYTFSCLPIPAPGTLYVDYMAQGKWYRLYDKGNGALKGLDTSYGSGSVNYSTGSVIITLGALPDNSSSILFFWGTAVSTFNRSNTTPANPKIEFQLNHFPVAPNSFSAAWSTYTLTDNGSGLLTGTGGSGTIVYSTGKVVILPTLLPAIGSNVTCNYSYGTPILDEFTSPMRDQQGDVPLQLNNTGIIPKTVELEFSVQVDESDTVTVNGTYFDMPRPSWVNTTVSVQDNGSGQLNRVSSAYGTEGIATINYSTGAISLHPEVNCRIPLPLYTNTFGGTVRDYSGGEQSFLFYHNRTFDGFSYAETAARLPITGGWVKVRYRASDTPTSAVGEVHTTGNITFDLTTDYLEYIQNNSVRFDLGGKTYFDLLGVLYHTINVSNGSAVTAGTIDYSTGIVTLTDWTAASTNAVVLKSLLTQVTAQSVDHLMFRTPGAPIRPGSLYFQANRLNGEQISCTSGMDGAFDSAAMYGTVDFETGVTKIRFGSWVTPAGHESEPWYNIENVDAAGKMFKPIPIDPSTARFNCVITTYLPLDSHILGLDPVRLPFDGKVAVFKKGDVVVIHNTQSVTCSNPVVAGQTIDCSRVRLARLEVQDALGVIVDPAKYTENLDAGTVTFATPLSLIGYTQPLKVFHTVEDMALATDVEINGRISLNKPLSHAYPSTTSYVSSALIIGDLYARWTNPFSQQTWTSVWQDSRIGAAITPQYQYTTNPFIVTNGNSIQQRWALIFTSTTNFNIVGETLGQIATGTINTETAPLNPITGLPYFRISASGWGTGWASGNLLRFNTIAANYPAWLARTVLQSSPSIQKDSFRILCRRRYRRLIKFVNSKAPFTGKREGGF
jgi:hypothetical protein